ncbi:MAG: glucose-6-phosphate dehydrogenase assembly protein OpcA [Verrucomicrobiaceae bacterium]|nr:glucose-6-phosphate dehydrogenase assembly protein OpcA [Verrucomicrobiaceae bacterium]
MTTSTAEISALGMPVEVRKIGGELKKLWCQGDEKMSRASLMNLAVYSEAPGSLEQNTHLVAEIALEHACRALVITADANALSENVDAWISAHCHVSRAGNKQICSEQLSFLLAGPSARLLPNIIFSHLDTDLPLHLWWQGEFHDPMDAQLWSWVDRLVYDSRDWSDFDEQMRLVEDAQQDAKQRVVLCDLNWARLLKLRLAIAQFFDSPAALERLRAIERVEIDYAPGARSTALLLVGWLAAQLRWKVAGSDSQDVKFNAANGKAVAVRLREVDGASISRCSSLGGEMEWRVTRIAGGELLDATVLIGGSKQMQQLLPAGEDGLAQLMSAELMRGGPHHVYLRAVEVMRKIL